MKSIVHFAALFALCLPCAGFAQGGGVKGGDAVACFDENKEPVVSDQKLTDYGRKHLWKAMTREEWRIQHTDVRTPFYDGLKDKSYEDALEALIGVFKEFPLFTLKLVEINAHLKPYWYGERAPKGMRDVKDSGSDIELTDGCQFVQAVRNDINVFSYDPDIHAKFSPLSRAMMQFHELIYYFGATYSGFQTSLEVEAMIISFVTQFLPIQDQYDRFATYGVPKRNYVYPPNSDVRTKLRENFTQRLDLMKEISRRIKAGGNHPCLSFDWAPIQLLDLSLWPYVLYYQDALPRAPLRAVSELNRVMLDIKKAMKVEVQNDPSGKCSYKGEPLESNDIRYMEEFSDKLLQMMGDPK